MSTKAINYLILGLVIFSSCKKGEEDPALTLATRTMRICGEWKLRTIESASTYNIGEEDQVDVKINGDGNQISELQVWGKDSVWIESSINSYTFTINRDGTWSKFIDVNISRKLRVFGSFTTATTTYRRETTANGTWAFTRKTKGKYEDKEQVQFIQKEHTQMEFDGTVIYDEDKNDNPPTIETFAGSGFKTTTEHVSSGLVYDLVMLKSNEMKWKIAFNTSYTHIQPEPDPPSHSSTMTEIITWEAK